MSSGIKILAFSLIVLTGFSFCSRRPGNNRKQDTQSATDSSAEIIPAASDTSEEKDTEEYKPVSFDTAQETIVQSFDKDKWKNNVKPLDYTEEPIEKNSTSPGVPNAAFNFSKLGKIILIVLVVGLLAFLIWRLMVYAPPGDKTEKETSILFSEDHPKKMEKTQLDELLKAYLKEKNYRFAIRILYLITLKRFSETQLIHWNKEKTNRNYIYELAGTPVQQGFSKFTSFYDIAWYGEHTVNEQQFELINNIAEQLHRESTSSSTNKI